MNDHQHEFTRLRAHETELLGPCRICRVPAAEILARIVLERDARLGQVYDLLDAVAAILERRRADRSTCHGPATPRPPATRAKRGTR